MKRKSGPDPSTRVQKRFPRQDPVSCESCRKKKLKCDRHRPCSSCVTRRLDCSFITSAQNESNRNDQHPERAWQSSFRISQTSQATYPRDSSPRPAGPDPGIQSRESLATAEWLEHIHMGDRVPAALSPQLRAELDERGVSSSQSANQPRIVLPLPSSSWIANANPATVDLVQHLPKEEDTVELLRYYRVYIDYLYHIIITSVVEQQIDEVYRGVERGSPVNPAYLALIFAITGSSLFVQFAIESSAHAARCSQQFIFLAGAALVQANHLTYPTIEGLQAALIVQHNISTVHCSATVSGLFSLPSIITQAKDMLLHRIDTPQARSAREAEGFDHLEVEVKRRVWWDIVSLDWFLGFLSGPQEWTYLINTKFICTDKPLDLPDTAIRNRDVYATATPSHMTYFIERLKLAEVCRSIIDTVGPEQITGEEIDYAKILDLDRQLRQAQSEVADVFRLDSNSRRRFRSLYQQRPTLAWQSCILQQAYYSRLCRLHRPFFIRGARDPKYSYSHVVGMASARKVLEINRIMDEDEPKFPPSTAVVWAVMHHVFMAAVMMLLDVCYNPDEILGERRKEEVLDACRRLSKAQQSSALVKEGIDAMMGVLQKQYMGQKSAADTSTQVMGSTRQETHTHSDQTLPQVAQQLGQPGNPPPFPPAGNPVEQEQRGLEDIWCDLIDHGANFEFSGDDWTGLFSDLTNAAMPP
ncbi:hypothetical protein BJX64DRAFT_289860 [Aspergillus heterothallicus]